MTLRKVDGGYEWDKVFEAGDVVRLKSGGPPMTVEDVGPFMVKVVWFNGFDLHRNEFDRHDLLMVRPNDREQAA